MHGKNFLSACCWRAEERSVLSRWVTVGLTIVKRGRGRGARELFGRKRYSVEESDATAERSMLETVTAYIPRRGRRTNNLSTPSFDSQLHLSECSRKTGNKQQQKQHIATRYAKRSTERLVIRQTRPACVHWVAYPPVRRSSWLPWVATKRTLLFNLATIWLTLAEAKLPKDEPRGASCEVRSNETQVCGRELGLGLRHGHDRIN